MDKEELKEYLATRRQGWPYEEVYRIEDKGGHRFIAWIGDELAGLAWIDELDEEEMDAMPSALMHMDLKAKFKEFGIGTELLETLMSDLEQSGYKTVRYEIGLEYYAFQIYQNLGFEVDSRDMEKVHFVRHLG